ncbi:alpha-galactosidase [Paludibacter sp. 221]|uniref:alpha-galactosidase n=1 Tax=Paludibacter sp. 221 TaxID=2302939 RepID=UPI0013CFB38D|nr:alpha-galactosidase [Paludibacter sp. 221]NDV46724.1 alpha-galactosidase [Paludibacter sp. 221]
MKKFFLSFLLIGLFSLPLISQSEFIRISTDDIDLVIRVAPQSKRVYQAYLGDKLMNESEFKALSFSLKGGSEGSVSARGWEVYPASGAEDFFEPAFAIQHNDGNMTSIFRYVSHEVNKIDDNVTETVINLKDDVYPVNVKLVYHTFGKENIIKTWTEINHTEKKPVTISRYASSMLYFESPAYYLTEFSGDWAMEARMSTQQLQFGKKILETKLGSRAAMHVSPFFQVGLGQPAQEQQGTVVLGTLAWSGNFQFTFEVDNSSNLRIISGINPYASNYELKPKENFVTPEFIFTISKDGTSKASRNFHTWARNYQLKDGKGDRLTLLNNWEATQFNFDEDKLVDIMGEARMLGVDMFLLDDGWFGNKYPREKATTTLGDWDVTKDKLPHGIPFLVEKAKENGVKFGIWIEPEMISPESELIEKHPDWAIRLPNREPYYYRSQLVLDMSNPKVQDFVFGVVDNIMSENPDVAFLKWDCNSPITNIYSPYLKTKQNQLYIDHNRGVVNVFKRVNEKYPDLPMMLCAGGGGRCDYESLKYFTEFWCSDNTDPIERIYIQWGFSQFFPAKSMDAHVTSWNRRTSIKFRVDVAMMCKMGFDIRTHEMSETDQKFCQQAVADYKRLKPVILDGDQYRLVSPYETNHMSVMYANEEKTKAVLFSYDIHPRMGEKTMSVKLQGLDPDKKYKIEEINLIPERKSNMRGNGETFSGDFLMKIGLNVFTTGQTNSRVIEITAE